MSYQTVRDYYAYRRETLKTAPLQDRSMVEAVLAYQSERLQVLEAHFPELPIIGFEFDPESMTEMIILDPVEKLDEASKKYLRTFRNSIYALSDNPIESVIKRPDSQVYHVQGKVKQAGVEVWQAITINVTDQDLDVCGRSLQMPDGVPFWRLDKATSDKFLR